MKVARLILLSLLLSLLSEALSQTTSDIKIQFDIKKTWDEQNHREVKNIWIMTFVVGFGCLVAMAMWTAESELLWNRKLCMYYDHKVTEANDKTTELLICSMQDKKQGIVFFDNPVAKCGHDDMRVKRAEKKLAKAQQNIAKLDTKIVDLEAKKQNYQQQVGEYKGKVQSKLGGMGLAIGAPAGNANFTVDAEPLVEIEVDADVMVTGGIDIQADVELDVEAPEIEVEVGADVEVEIEAPEVEIEGEIEVEVEAPEVEADLVVEGEVEVEVEVDAEAEVEVEL